jgi:isopenicillin N synthase-like dioxygenase
VTVLIQHKVMGLQVRPPNLSGPVLEGEEWLDAPIIPGAVLVNIGETMTFLSGGVMKSTLHRVARSPRIEDQGKERFSCVYFCHANEDTKLEMVEGIKGGNRKTPPLSCVTGKRVETVKDWIQHRHSRGTAVAMARENAKPQQAEAPKAIEATA